MGISHWLPNRALRTGRGPFFHHCTGLGHQACGYRQRGIEHAKNQMTDAAGFALGQIVGANACFGDTRGDVQPIQRQSHFGHGDGHRGKEHRDHGCLAEARQDIGFGDVGIGGDLRLGVVERPIVLALADLLKDIGGGVDIRAGI